MSRARKGQPTVLSLDEACPGQPSNAVDVDPLADRAPLLE